jgi:hypothetical protein
MEPVWHVASPVLVFLLLFAFWACDLPFSMCAFLHVFWLRASSFAD